MNLKGELQKMNIRDLKSICKELGLSCPTSKRGIIKRLLDPLSKKYRMKSLQNYSIDILTIWIQGRYKN